MQLTAGVTGRHRGSAGGTRLGDSVVRIAVSLLMGFVAVACRIDGVEEPLDGNSFVVRNVRVSDGLRVVEDATVVVRSGRIITVGHGAPPASLPLVDGAGRTLLPASVGARLEVRSEGGLRTALRVGRIAPGARADLVLVDGNPLTDTETTHAVVRVFRNGFDVARGTARAHGSTEPGRCVREIISRHVLRWILGGMS